MAKSKKPRVRRVKDHDIFMRGIFSYTAFVLKILQYIIPPNLKSFIDFSTLKIVSDMHISDKLLPTQSDTIYEAVLSVAALPEKVRNDKDLPPFRFCFLGEFKSSKPSEPIDLRSRSHSGFLSLKMQPKPWVERRRMVGSGPWATSDSSVWAGERM